MRISLSINGNPQYTASLSGAGYLSAHLNVRDRPKENHLSAVVQLVATDTSQDTENVRMDWPSIPLHAGDAVELKLLPPGEGDPPARRAGHPAGHPKIRGTCLPAQRMPPNWSRFSDFEARLMDLVSRFEQTEPPDEFVKIRAGRGFCGLGVGRFFSFPRVPSPYASHAGRNEGRAVVGI